MEEWIKKSDAIEAIKDNSFALGDDYLEINGYGAIDDIRALPSADRPRGELKYMGTYYKCSVCGSEFMDEITFMGELNYSPSCGAKMKGADDETTND